MRAAVLASASDNWSSPDDEPDEDEEVPPKLTGVEVWLDLEVDYPARALKPARAEFCNDVTLALYAALLLFAAAEKAPSNSLLILFW